MQDAPCLLQVTPDIIQNWQDSWQPIFRPTYRRVHRRDRWNQGRV